MNTWLRKVLKILGILVGVLAVLVIILIVFVQFTWDRKVSRAAPQMSAPADAQVVARGEYLYKYSLNCWDCHGSQGSHSPDEPQAGGREFDMTDVGLPGGFGYIYASNITPDPETGIGTWSDGELVRALREGLDPEGYLLFPIMEAEWWSGLSDEDTLALVAYMRSMPPVRNEVPDSQLTFAAKALIALGIVKAQPAITERVTAPPRGATAEYGEYLAYHASTCVGCHTPRNYSTGQFDLTRPFAGGLAPVPDKRFSTIGSNLTPDPATGIGNWTEEQFMTAMRTGLRPNGSVMLPFMPWPSYSRWDEDDLRAVWLYLSSLEPIAHEIPATTLTGASVSGTSIERGEGLYDVYCVICHGEQGIGSSFTTVALKDVAKSLDDARLSGFISNGLPGSAMPGFGETLTGEQIADLVVFIRSWQ
ncbi:MAG TPA: cytochrome c [Anaerolineales bacterium]|nr:cytochrome c [Anaerolineales bacterium]